MFKPESHNDGETQEVTTCRSNSTFLKG